MIENHVEILPNIMLGKYLCISCVEKLTPCLKLVLQ